MGGIPLVSIKKLAGNTAGIKRVESNLSQFDFSNPVDTRQEPEVELRKEVNTSIIALKREANSLETVIQQAVQTLANINKQIADCVKKSDVTDIIQSGNMNPITSNAVYKATQEIVSTKISIAHHIDYAYLYKVGRVVYFSLSSDWTEMDGGAVSVGTIPQGYRPIAQIKLSEATPTTNITMTILSSVDGGGISCYNYDGAFNYALNGNYFGCWITEE